MHHWRRYEYRNEQQHPPEEADEEEEDGKVAEESNCPQIVWRDLFFISKFDENQAIAGCRKDGAAE